MTEISQNDHNDLPGKLEAILFVAESSVSINQLSETLEMKPADIEKALADLKTTLEQGHGIRLQKHGGKVQFTTAPEHGGLIEKFLGLEASARLTRASLETLAIVAYKQPITHPGIDAIRGVNSDGVLKSLLFKGMVEEIGRAETPGRPILYGTTREFLQNFGINSLEELPDINSLDQPKPDEAQIRILKD